MDRLYPLSLSPLYGGGLLKRFRFFLKKYISVLVVIVLLITTVFSFNISAAGKNLFNGTWEQGRLQENGSVSSAVLFYITSSAVSLSPGTYIINVPSDFQVGYVLLNSSGSPISNNLSYSLNYIEFTTTVKCSIRICLHRSNNNYFYPDDAPELSLTLLNIVNYTDLDIESLTFAVLPEDPYTIQNPPQHSSGYLLWNPQLPSNLQPFDMSSNTSFTEILTLNAPSGLSEGNYKLSLRPVFYFNSDISDSVGSARFTITLGLSEKVVVQTTVPGKKVSGYGNPNNIRFDIDLDISYDPSIHQQLFNYMEINYYFIGSSVSGNLGYVGFNVAPRLIAPDSYSSFEDDTISSVEGEVNNFIGGYSSQVEEYMDQFSNEWNIFLPQYEESLVGFKYIANKFFEHPWIYNVVSICIIAGVAPLFVRTFTRRRK